MHAYYHNTLPGDPRLPHRGRAVPTGALAAIGVLHWSIPVPTNPESLDDEHAQWRTDIDKVAAERDYKNRDVVESGRALLGDAFEERMAAVYAECVVSTLG